MSTRFALVPLCAALALACSGAHAAGFALAEQSASGLGDAYAGAAATGRDASTVWFNPAGLMLIKDRQLVVAAHAIKPSMKFDGTLTPSLGGGNGGDAGSVNYVPNAYYAVRLAPEMVLGVGVNAPFGLSTEYDSTWKGRFLAIQSKVETVNVNPGVGLRITPTVSVGIGGNVLAARAKLTSDAGAAGLAAVRGDDVGYGWNVGALWQATPATRVGAAYRSQVRLKLEGDADFSGLPASNGPVTANLTLPDSASLSLVHALSPAWTLLADATWTDWSDFETLTIVRTSGALLLPPTVENWRDSWRYSLGVDWRSSDTLTLRAGVAWDKTPVRDATRTARIPDSNRTWASLGAQFGLGASGRVDLGYAHVFFDDASIEETAALAPLTLSGTYQNSADILSAQYTVDF